jgi:hypothetical protein
VNDLIGLQPRRSSGKAILNLAIIAIVVVAISVLALMGMFLTLSDRYTQLEKDYNSLQSQASSLQLNYTNTQQELATEQGINSYLQGQVSNLTQSIDHLGMESAYFNYSISLSYDNLTLMFPPSSGINSSFSTINVTLTGIQLDPYASGGLVEEPWLVPASTLRAVPSPADGSGTGLMINTDAFRSSFYENDQTAWQGPIVYDSNITGYDIHYEIYNLTLTGIVQLTYYLMDKNITFYLDNGDGSPGQGLSVQVQ